MPIFTPKGAPKIIQGIADAEPIPLLLDLYPGAYYAGSFRRLSRTYDGPAARIVRLSDGAYEDFDFLSNDIIDVASILAFVGNSTFVPSIVYDQSGNGNNFIQSVDCPELGTGGSIYTRSGVPVMKFSTIDNMYRLSVGLSVASVFTMAAATAGGSRTMLGDAAGAGRYQFRINSSGKLNLVKRAVVELGTANTTIATNSFNALGIRSNVSSGNVSFYLNAVNDGDRTFSPTGLSNFAATWGASNAGGHDEDFIGDMSELVIYQSYKDESDCIGIQTEQVSFYERAAA